MQYQPISLSFYEHNDVVSVAKSLLGKILFTRIGTHITSGLIVETEAYSGRNDKACHANNGLRTLRNEIMYKNGGYAYVYLCYGIHQMFNVVTNKEGLADAVLIRALEPIKGIEVMKNRRGTNPSPIQISSGPGKLTKALGIDRSMNGLKLNDKSIWIEEGNKIPLEEIQTDVRIGVGYAGKDALKPWRFYIRGNKHVSKGIQKNPYK